MVAFQVALLIALIGGDPRPQAASGDRAQVDAAYRSARRLQASLSVGLSLVRFEEALGDLAGEVLIARDGASTEPTRDAVGAYAAGVDTLRESVILWRARVFGRAGDADGVMRKYDVDASETGVRRVWAIAELQLGAGHAVLAGDRQAAAELLRQAARAPIDAELARAARIRAEAEREAAIGDKAALSLAARATSGTTIGRLLAISEVRKAGASAKAAVPLLIPLLEDPDWNVRAAAVEALRAMGPAAKEAVPALLKAASSDALGIKAGASAALQAISRGQ